MALPLQFQNFTSRVPNHITITGFKMGLVYSMEVHHGFGLGQTSSVDGYVKETQANDMEAWWVKYRGIELKRVKRALLEYF